MNAWQKKKNKMSLELTEKETDFLNESNAIEGVYDQDSFNQASLAWQYLKRQKTLYIGAILKAHKILMLHQTHLKPDERGYFRQCRVWVGGREGIEWRKIRGAIKSWIKNTETSVKIPGQNHRNIQVDHVEFEKIHPFVDGNGRIGRMLLNWERLKADLPILIILEDEKQEYYKWFE